VGGHSLLQGVFLTQGSSPGLLHRRRILCPLSHQGKPKAAILQKKKAKPDCVGNPENHCLGCSIFHSFPSLPPHPQMTKSHPCPLSLLPSTSLFLLGAQVRASTMTLFPSAGTWEGRSTAWVNTVWLSVVTRGWGPKAVLQQQGLDWIALKLFPRGGVVRSSVGHPVETLNCWARAGSQPGSHRLTLSMGFHPQVAGR